MSHIANTIWEENLEELKQERRFRKLVPRTDGAYLNQLKLDQDIFNGLLPELGKEKQ